MTRGGAAHLERSYALRIEMATGLRPACPMGYYPPACAADGRAAGESQRGQGMVAAGARCLGSTKRLISGFNAVGTGVGCVVVGSRPASSACRSSRREHAGELLDRHVSERRVPSGYRRRSPLGVPPALKPFDVMNANPTSAVA